MFDFTPDNTDRNKSVQFLKERCVLFVQELNQLTKKYGLEIWGCHCCGSPSLIDLMEKGFVEGIVRLSWDKEKETYDYEEG